MFEHRWDNWVGDFTGSFSASQLPPAAREHVSEILIAFGATAQALLPRFPDELEPEHVPGILTRSMPGLGLPDRVRPHVTEVVATFLEYLQESGRLADGSALAARARGTTINFSARPKAGGLIKGETVRRPANVSALGRNDPCPCGSGKKFKKCCMGE